MSAEFRIVVFSEDEAKEEGYWGGIGFDFKGMTAPMRTTMMKYLRSTLAKLEQHERDHPEDSYGDAEVRDVEGSEGASRDVGRSEDGQEELERRGREGAPRGEQEGRSSVVPEGLVLPPGVKL